MELKPGDQTAEVSLGIAYSRSGDNVLAQEVLQAVAADSSDGRARYELALVLAKLGQQEEANANMTMVAKSNDPELSEAAKSFMEGAAPGEQKGFDLKLSAGPQYDSNVILEQDGPAGPK